MTEQDLLLCMSGLGSAGDGLHTSDPIADSLEITATQFAARKFLREQVEMFELSHISNFRDADSIAEGENSVKYGDEACSTTVNVAADVTQEVSMSAWSSRSPSIDEVNSDAGTSV